MDFPIRFSSEFSIFVILLFIKTNSVKHVENNCINNQINLRKHAANLTYIVSLGLLYDADISKTVICHDRQQNYDSVRGPGKKYTHCPKLGGGLGSRYHV